MGNIGLHIILKQKLIFNKACNCKEILIYSELFIQSALTIFQDVFCTIVILQCHPLTPSCKYVH